MLLDSYQDREANMAFQTKDDFVAEFLREAILSGEFPRGMRLKQAKIAERLQTSITPVREALKLLEAEGYIASQSHQGATVAQFDPATSRETLNLRLTLESQLVSEAVDKASPFDIRQFFELAEEFRVAVGANSSTAARRANYRLHRCIYQKAEMPQTLQFVQILWARYPFDVVSRIAERPRRAVTEHEQLLDRIANRDALGAVAVIRHHIESGWEELQLALSADPS